MVDFKPSGLLGNFIKQRRQNLGLSQRTLGQMLNPQVTMQFISNLERGVTPLPVAHIPTLTKILQIGPQELPTLLEREYSLKLSRRVGTPTRETELSEGPPPEGSPNDILFMKTLFEAYCKSDPGTQRAFIMACETILSVNTPIGLKK